MQKKKGIVLLKNEDNLLPLKGKKLNVFGAGSVCPFLGGAGSGAITTDDPVTFYEALDEAKAFSDTALIMISRTSAEGSDIGEDILKLSDTELKLVEKVTSSFGAPEKPSEWNFEFPYVFSLFRYVLNNFVNVILWAARILF